MEISVIIPAWNEAPLIEDAVDWARRIGDEVIVSDGNSPDGTGEIAAKAGAKALVGTKSRGIQLDCGAQAAKGDILLFLHADTRLPARARGDILDALADPAVVGGNFLPRFLPKSWFTRLLCPANDLRRLLIRRYFGDSGIFVRRGIYHALGGFRPYPLMDDFDFSARLERAGRTVYLRRPPIYASARRFEGREIRTLLLWLRLQVAYSLGTPPDRLADAYPDIRSSQPGRFITACRRMDGVNLN